MNIETECCAEADAPTMADALIAEVTQKVRQDRLRGRVEALERQRKYFGAVLVAAWLVGAICGRAWL